MAVGIPGDLDRALERAIALGGELEEAARFHFAAPGKRVRSRLALAACEALGLPREPAVDLAVACELVHNASLVHDDLQDGDRMRRGRESIWHAFGTDVAINLGTALLARAVETASSARAPEPARSALALCVARATLELVHGQSADNATARGSMPSLVEYVDIARAKTGPLLALPVEGALRLAGAEDGECKAAREAMGWLGAAFQVQDDLLDLFGAKERESAGADLRAGSPSAPVIHFLELASATERAAFTRWTRTRRGDDARMWVERIRSSRAVEVSLAQLRSHEREGLALAAGLRAPLRAVVEETARRLSRPIEPLGSARCAPLVPSLPAVAAGSAVEARS